MAASVADHLFTDPAFPRIVAWMALEGRSVTSEMSGHPFMERLARPVADRHPDDAPDRVGATITVLLALGLLAPVVNEALGRVPDDGRIRAVFVDVLPAILDGPPPAR